MARNQADTAKHLIRVLQQGGAAADSVANTLVKGNKAAVNALLAAVRGGATEAEAVALVRKSMGALSRKTYDQLTEHGLKTGTHQADAAQSYLELLANTDVNGFKVSKTFVQNVFKVPFPNGGPSVNDLFTGQMGSMSRNLVNVTRDAYINGSTVAQVSKIIRNQVTGEGGELMSSTIRRKADALGRTAISKVANATREATFIANDDIVNRVIFVATLDHRTSSICVANDGLWWYLGDPSLQRPPLHVNCRSTLAPVLNGENLNTVKKELDRQQVVPKSAEQLKKKGLKTRGGKVRKPSSTDRSPLEAKSLGGYKTYGEWFKNQPAEYQKSILGPKAFKAYKSTGNLNQALGQANVSQSTWKPGKKRVSDLRRGGKGGSGGGGTAPPTTKPPPAARTAAPPQWKGTGGSNTPAPEIQAFTDAAFTNPAFTGVLGKLDAPGWIKPNPRESAYHHNNKIHMGTHKSTDAYGAAVFRHEVGHYVENKLGNLAKTVEMDDLRKLDRKHMSTMDKKYFKGALKRQFEDDGYVLSSADKRYSKANVQTTIEKDWKIFQNQYLADAKKVYVDGEGYTKWTKSKLPKGSVAREILDSMDMRKLEEYRQVQVCSSLLNMHKNKEYLHTIRELSYADGHRAFQAKKKFNSNVNLLDLVGATTKNRFGAGHSNNYYNSRNHTEYMVEVKAGNFVPSSKLAPADMELYRNGLLSAKPVPVAYGQNTEAFANLFDLIHKPASGVTFGDKLAKLVAPNLYKYVDKVIKDAQ